MDEPSTARVEVRPPRPSRKRRPSRIGVVTSDVCDKTIKVEVAHSLRHPKYGKYLRRRTVLHAHDEKNEARRGDTVEVMECRPMSRTKTWRLVRIVERAPAQAGESVGA
jgi:small subunit ribosomal protein S17